MSNFAGKPIDPALNVPLYWQLYEHLRAAILSGRLKNGAKLPSTRALAEELNISRNTALNAYQQLLAEGYLESVEASGTFVASVLPEPVLPTQSPQILAVTRARQNQENPTPRLSKIGRDLVKAPQMPAPLQIRASERGQRAFRAGMPAFDAFPFELWGKLVTRQIRRTTGNTLMYQHPTGYRPLREAIAAHATVTRRVRCTPDQIVIVSGSQGALALVARVLIDPGDPVWMENPGYLGARGALLGAGAQIIPVPVDNEGLIVEAGIARCPNARMVYLTPSHQFPLGVTMSLARRLAVLDWAKRAGAYILEDDYDSEYRFAGRPLAALQGLDDTDCVIYIGTFSKVLFPALRLGYLILPPPLVDPFLAARRFIDIHPPALEQAVLADFIVEGHFGRHLRRMRTLYAERRATFLEAIAEFPDITLDLYAPETGMHCIGWLPDGIDDQTVVQHAAAHDVDVFPLSKFSLEPIARQGLLLGYAGVDQQHIYVGVRRLAAAFREIRRKSETGTIG